MPLARSFVADVWTLPIAFPLSVSASGRYLQTATGQPFFLHGDTAWSAAVQLTPAQMDVWLNDAQSKGINAVIVNLIEHKFSSQTPFHRNPLGADPFTSMTVVSNFATACDFSTPNEPYWANLDYMFAGARARGIMILAFPAYMGFDGGDEGWQTCVVGDTAGHLQSYGAYLATRYQGFGNVIWSLSGDTDPGQTALTQQWNIVTGMRSVRTDLLIYAKAGRHTSGYSMLVGDGGLASYPGWNINNVYPDNTTIVSECATEYARTVNGTPVPTIMDEAYYEGGHNLVALDVRREHWQTRLSGAAYFNGQNPLWTFGAPAAVAQFQTNPPPTPSSTSPDDILISTYLNTAPRLQAQYVRSLFLSYSWWLGNPVIDSSFVTTALGSAATAITPLLASNGSFAFIYTPAGGGFTVNLAALSISSIQARWYDPTNATFTAASGSPFANSGTHAFTIPGTNSAGDSDWVLVLG